MKKHWIGKNGQMAWEIYDLLGYGGLTPEIVEYLMGLLTASDEFRPVQLFKRLENFYLRWCDGEFIDALQDNYPQKKMSQLQGQGIQQGMRQVDVCAGLNVMILLLELHLYPLLEDDLQDEIAFYPCGQPDTEGFDEWQLLRIISYCDCFDINSFGKIVGPYLLGVDLSEVRLYGTCLIAVNLDFANLIAADLRNAILYGASLREADLSAAEIRGADLNEADLSGADLSAADLKGADLKGADLENISWDEETNWDDVRGLKTALNVPEDLKLQLGLE